MSVHSGKFGVVNGQSTSMGWNLTDGQAAQPFRTSNSACGTIRRQGVRSWSGSYNMAGGTPSVMPGDSISWAGYTAPDDDVSGTGQRASGTALVSSVVITWNWETAEILKHVVNFVGHLALTWDQGVYSDATSVVAPEVCGTKVQYDDATKKVITDLKSASLTISSDIKSYVNSSTYVGSKCWTGQKAGPIDFEIALVQDCNERDESGGDDHAPPLGTDLALEMFVDSTDYWDLQWAQVMEYSNLTVDNDTGDIISRTINLAMNGNKAGTNGSITKPGAGSAWWPA